MYRRCEPSILHRVVELVLPSIYPPVSQCINHADIFDETSNIKFRLRNGFFLGYRYRRIHLNEGFQEDKVE